MYIINIRLLLILSLSKAVLYYLLSSLILFSLKEPINSGLLFLLIDISGVLRDSSLFFILFSNFSVSWIVFFAYLNMSLALLDMVFYKSCFNSFFYFLLGLYIYGFSYHCNFFDCLSLLFSVFLIINILISVLSLLAFFFIFFCC